MCLNKSIRYVPRIAPRPVFKCSRVHPHHLVSCQDPEADVESEVLRASLRLCRSRFPCIHLAADVISGLARHQDRVAVKAVDAVLEAMHRGIEVRTFPGAQRFF